MYHKLADDKPVQDKQKIRVEIERHVKEYLDGGGEIEVVASDEYRREDPKGYNNRKKGAGDGYTTL